MCNVSAANQQMDKMVVFQRVEHNENDDDNDIGQERGEEFSFDIKQIRDKFKQCMSKCKKASLLMKTASGIKSFQEDRGFGKWFHCLLPLIQTKESCQPELALEPSLAIERRSVEMPTFSSLDPILFKISMSQNLTYQI